MRDDRAQLVTILIVVAFAAVVFGCFVLAENMVWP